MSQDPSQLQSQREPSRRTRGLSPLPIPNLVPEPETTAPPYAPPNLSPIGPVAPLPTIIQHPIDNSPQHFTHVSDASSSQYNWALYPPDRRNPNLQNNFQAFSSSSIPNCLPSSMSTISSHSLPVPSPTTHLQHPFINHLHTTQQMDNHILAQLQQTIDNLNHIINNLRQDLDDVRRELRHSNQQNQHLHQKLLQSTRPNPNSPQQSIQPVPTIIHTDASIASHTSPIPPNTLIPLILQYLSTHMIL